MYSYYGSLYKKYGSLKGVLKRKPKEQIPLYEETSLGGIKLIKKDENKKVFLRDFRTK